MFQVFSFHPLRRVARALQDPAQLQVEEAQFHIAWSILDVKCEPWSLSFRSEDAHGHTFQHCLSGHAHRECRSRPHLCCCRLYGVGGAHFLLGVQEGVASLTVAMLLEALCCYPCISNSHFVGLLGVQFCGYRFLSYVRMCVLPFQYLSSYQERT